MEIYYPKLVDCVNSPCLSLHTVVYYKNSLFLFGGLNEIIAHQNTLYEFDIIEQKWKVLKNSQTNIPSPRCGHTAVEHDSKMYIFGGKQHMDLFDDLWTFEFETKNWTKVANIAPRAFHSSVKYNRKWYILGGIKRESPEFIELDLDTLKTREIQALPQFKNLFGHSSTLIKDKMYVFGGEKSKEVFNSFYECDLQDFKWKELELQGVIPKSRSKHFFISNQDTIYMFGGGSGNGRYKNTFYECKNFTWEEKFVSRSSSFSGQGFSGVLDEKGEIWIFGGHKGTLLLGSSSSSNELFILSKIILKFSNEFSDVHFNFQ